MQTARETINDFQGIRTEDRAFRLSQHAVVRGKQRGINRDVIDLILKHGSEEPRPGGAVELRLNKRERFRIITALKRQIKVFERTAGKAIVIAGDGEIITVYNRL